MHNAASIVTVTKLSTPAGPVLSVDSYYGTSSAPSTVKGLRAATGSPNALPAGCWP